MKDLNSNHNNYQTELNSKTILPYKEMINILTIVKEKQFSTTKKLSLLHLMSRFSHFKIYLVSL